MATLSARLPNLDARVSSMLLALFDHSKLGVLVLDSTDCVVASNSILSHMLGYSDEEELMSHLSAHHQKFIRELVTHISANDETEHILLQIPKKDGTTLLARSFGFPLSTEAVSYYVGIIRPTFDQQETLDALVDSTERYRNFVESSPMGIHMYTLDKEDRLVFESCNPAAEQILGIPHRQFIGQTIEEVFPAFVETEVPQRCRRAALTGESWSNEQIQYQDEKVVGAFEIKAFQTKRRSMAIMFWDITEKKRVAAELKEAHDNLETRVAERTDELVKANQDLKDLTARFIQSAKMVALGELTAGIAHELNQPLNAIKIISQGLLMDIKRERLDLRDVPRKVDSIIQMINKMAEIIYHMHIFTRQTHGDSSKPVDVNRLLLASFTFVEERMKSSDIEIRKQLSDARLIITADTADLEQAILNILSNAFYALVHSDKKKKCLKVLTKDDNDQAVILIEDNGIGIPEEAMEKIFIPFFTTKDPDEGIGLGLSISLKIIEENKGRISVVSKQGEFTRLEIRFPLIKD